MLRRIGGSLSNASWICVRNIFERFLFLWDFKLISKNVDLYWIWSSVRNEFSIAEFKYKIP